MEQVVPETALMSYEVVQNEQGEFICKVTAHGDTVNEWNLGLNEEVAQSKVATIIDSYTKGMAYVQSQVRTIFAEVEG